MAGATGNEAVNAADRFAAAHRALKADPSVQFSMGPVQPPPQPPQWLIDFLHFLGRLFRPIGRFLRWIDSFLPDAPYARIFFWVIVAALLGLLLWIVYQRVRYGEWRWPRRRVARAAAIDADEEEAWIPDAAPARAWLAEADALAAEGRFAEAAHLLLFRSIEDIARHRPRLVRPALTSRELAAAEVVPASARGLFAGIAALVERSLFGGRPVGRGDWSAARSAYADFALPGTWRA